MQLVQPALCVWFWSALVLCCCVLFEESAQLLYNRTECVWLLENLKLLLDEPDLLRLPFADIEPAYRRRTCIRLAVVRFWRDAAMRNQYDINATTIGGRPGGDGLRRDQAEDCEADASLPSAFAADERANKRTRTS